MDLQVLVLVMVTKYLHRRCWSRPYDQFDVCLVLYGLGQEAISSCFGLPCFWPRPFSRRKDLSPKHVQPNITFTKASVPCVLARQTKAITKAMDKPCSRTGQQDNTQRPSAKAFWLDMLSGQQAFSFKSDLDPFWQEPPYLSSQRDSRDGDSTVEMPVLQNLRNSS